MVFRRTKVVTLSLDAGDDRFLGVAVVLDLFDRDGLVDGANLLDRLIEPVASLTTKVGLTKTGVVASTFRSMETPTG